MNASPTTGNRRFSRRVRRAVNSAHVVFAVGLLGVEWVMLLIAVLARMTNDDTLRHSAYRLMRVFVFAGGVPFALLSLITGVLLCLFTPWGLWQHLWIKVKIVLLLAVIAAGAGVVGQFAERLIADSAPGGKADALPPVQTWHLVVVICQLLALIAATALSVFKPSGDRTRSRTRLRRTAVGAVGDPAATPGGPEPATTAARGRAGAGRRAAEPEPSPSASSLSSRGSS
ncbi:DUF2269 family protein [Embleya sp. AB8]|uniref:DUF2269 family protein n=1 Tax=Embleya sp. AB8 TaxID=3156304 RepID=UPI003C791B9B